MHTLKHLAIAAAMVGLVAPAQAEYYPGSTDFEGDSPLADACWSNVVEAAIEFDASVADAIRSPNLPPPFDKAPYSSLTARRTATVPSMKWSMHSRTPCAIRSPGRPSRHG